MIMTTGEERFSGYTPRTVPGFEAALEAAPAPDGLGQIAVDTLLIAYPLGNCAGVERSVVSLDKMVDEHPGENVHCYHDIVHSTWTRKYFESRGVTFFDDPGQVPEGAPVMLSAHGTAPAVREAIDGRAGMVIDSTCPIISKVHTEATQRVRKGDTVLLIGEPGSDEAEGTRGIAENVHVVEHPESVDALLESGVITPETSVSILMQTTLAEADWTPVIGRIKQTWGDAWMPKTSDICFATTNRQNAANMLIDEGAEAVVVVTAPHSHNGMALARVVEGRGVPAFPVESARELPEALAGIGKLGITAAASAPAQLIVNQVMARLRPQEMRLVHAATEEKFFPLPRELR